MADEKISAMPSGTPAVATDEYVIARAGDNFKLTAGEILALQSLVLISDTLLVSNTATFDITSIPGTYKSLHVLVQARSAMGASSEDNMLMRFNNDSGSNYDNELMQSYGATGQDSESLGQTSFKWAGDLPAASSQAGSSSQFVIDVFNYASTTFFKNMTSTGSVRLDTGANNTRLWVAAGQWLSTAAVNRITFLTASGSNFLAGSRCTVWGMQ